jgi:hypothetical protein
MLKVFKIFFIALVVVLLFLSVAEDMPMMQPLQEMLNLSAYLRLASLLTLMAGCFWAWGYQYKIRSSQKYNRAEKALAEAGDTVKRKKEVCDKMEEGLKAAYAKKEQELENRINDVRQECREQMQALKKQNIELKENVANLLRMVKKKNAP